MDDIIEELKTRRDECELEDIFEAYDVVIYDILNNV